jgi:hypothetical protein
MSAVQIVWSCIIHRHERASLREDNAMLMDKLGQLWEIQKQQQQQQQQQHLLVASSEQAPHEQVSAGKICGSMWFCAFTFSQSAVSNLCSGNLMTEVCFSYLSLHIQEILGRIHDLYCPSIASVDMVMLCYEES